jgi:hypothetical protein
MPKKSKAPSRITVRHHEPVWETTTSAVDIPAGEDPVDYVREHLDRLITDAMSAADNGEQGVHAAVIEVGDRILSMDSDYELLDETGRSL